MPITTIGPALAKSVFRVRGADVGDHPVLKKRLRQGQVLQFFADLPICRIGMGGRAAVRTIGSGAEGWGPTPV